jgi:hypothetical protein
MSEQITHHSSSVPAERQSHPKIDFYFDAALHIVRRSKELAWEAKELIVTLLILLLLIQHALHVLLSG